ncbi:SusD/RagB family nutrient-binding outer membrane lipoprotein [Rufibacter soli]
MRKIFVSTLIAASLFTTSGCENWLDVNTNPNGPDQVVEPHLYLAPILSELASAVQFDGRYIGKYIANWHGQVADATWDRHGYAAASDAAGQIWRSTYYTAGLNLRDLIAKAEEQKKWDFAGIGYAIQAFSWQITTDYHGEIIMSQAFDPSLAAFDYDEQQVVYEEVKRLSMKALESLDKANGPDQNPNSRISESDLIYGSATGTTADAVVLQRERWRKFVYGLLALNEHHLTNKASYNPAKVIEYVDKSFTSNADDAGVRFTGSVTADANAWGPMRGNLVSPNVRQSKFIVELMDGTNPVLRDPALIGQDPSTTFAGQHLKDPRLTTMLAPAGDGQYRGVLYNGVTEYSVTAQRPLNLYGTTSDAANATAAGKYLFQNSVKFPLMTYSQLQFTKAEAAFKANQGTVALDAYKKAVNAHMDFVKSLTPATEQAQFDARRTKYMASPAIVPATAANLTLSHIMLQKYIAQWAWAFVEQWTDLRRYHYVGGPDGGSYDVINTPDAERVFKGYKLPTDANVAFFASNNGKPAYRVRPRYNSEYIWNVEALRRIGALNADYHTYEMWFSKK